MITEMSEVQCADPVLGKYFKRGGRSSTKTNWYKISGVKDTTVATENKK